MTPLDHGINEKQYFILPGLSLLANRIPIQFGSISKSVIFSSQLCKNIL